jgi:hypothetical protein
VRARVPIFIALLAGVLALVAAWALNASAADHWLAVHTGTVDEPGPYYAFWSGFGSDLAEFGIVGAICTGVYQLVRKYNCHEPRCWRIGNHSAAGGRFSLCYRHHPDFHGARPTSEMIKRLHEEHQEFQATLREKLDEGSADRVSRRHRTDNNAARYDHRSEPR